MTDEYVPLRAGAITVGKPLLFNVYDVDGALLLQQGHVVASREQLDTLYRRGLYHVRHLQAPLRMNADDNVVDARHSNLFTDLPEILDDLEMVQSYLVHAHEEALKRLERLVQRIHRSIERDPDAALGVVHTNTIEPSAREQTLYHAILCDRMCERLGWEAARRASVLSAALTANLALLPHQDKLNRSRHPLNDGQRAVLRKHPDLSLQALKRAGISDEICLAAVAQHHENADGSGYPLGLVEAQIVPEALLLALAERYIAMITQRAYRPRLAADAAIKELARAGVARTPWTALVQELTAYPPGVIVELANGEMAVVTQRGGTTLPRVRAILSSRGQAFSSAYLRDCRLPEFAIRRIVLPEHQPSLRMAQLWPTGSF